MRYLVAIAVALGLAAVGRSPDVGAVREPPVQRGAAAVDNALFQGLQWRNIGPFRGGRSVAVAGVAGDPQTYYFGGVGGGVWKTTDAGETWANVSDGVFKTSSVGAIAVAASDPNVLYVGMGEHAVRGVATSHGDGVYKSSDAGRTWVHLGLEKTRAISRIRIHPTNPDVVYIAAQGAPYGATKDRGLYKSTDGGRTWAHVLFVNDTSGASDLAMDPQNPRVLYASFWDHLRLPWHVRSGGPGSGFHKSVDGGETWRPINNGLPPLMGKTGIDVAADRVYALVEADPGGGLYRSDEGGATWTLVNETWTIRARAWYYMNVYADPANPEVVWITNAFLLKSIDGGRTFTTVSAPHGDHHDLWINPRDSRTIINANDGGANISFNGGRTWSTQANQPTGQFYRVITDRRLPYWVYGGQQDNSSIAIPSRAGGGGISEKDWHPVGGCENAFVAFDRADPALIYAGCYLGQISEYDTRTGTPRDVMAYPTLLPATPPRDMKYRFNWNAPIVVSRHNPKVIYHAANLVLRSENRGRTWTAASPDLTRDDDEKQGPGGGPITNEGAGGEIFGTIAYLAESPHDAGTLWTASDDGVVSVTRDAGKTWSTVTPKEIQADSLVNAVEVSPHDPATVYLAVSRYKFNDFTPHVFKTTDYGRTWSRRVDGIDPDAWVRVVREDPIRKDLLYAGTETGMYVSFDGGARWQSLQLNLPVTPINDLEVHDSDLVAATGGRAFWILDNVSPLRQVGTQTAGGEGVLLFKPERAVRFIESGGPGEGIPPSTRLGRNPPNGAVIDFVLTKPPDEAVAIEVLDANGQLVRRYDSGRAGGAAAAVRGGGPQGGGPQGGGPRGSGPPGGGRAGGGPGGPAPLTVRRGHNRVTWDLRHAPIPSVPGLFAFGSLQGRKALPGTYQVRVTAGSATATQSIEVAQDPRLGDRSADLAAQEAFLVIADRELAEIHQAVVRLRAVRQQLEDLRVRLRDSGRLTAGSSLAASGRALVDRLTAIEERLVQPRTTDGQTVLNFGMRLNQYYIYLRAAVDNGETGVTDGARQRLADLSAEWARHRAALATALGDELGAFNTLVLEAGVPAVVVPPGR